MNKEDIKTPKEIGEAFEESFGCRSDYFNHRVGLFNDMKDWIVNQYKFKLNKSKPSDKDLISEVKQNLKEINKDKKITDYNFDLGYSLGFLDGNDFSRQIPELTK